MDCERILKALQSSWSLESSSLYTPDCPAKGQCGVTALVIQDNFGGNILKTKISQQNHFYNRISGVILDFTISQFESPPDYMNVESSRDEAFTDTNDEQYRYLREAFKRAYS